MAKPRNRPDTVNSAYFADVTPLWVRPAIPDVRPADPPIEERFHAACYSLADWASSQLPRKSDKDWSADETGFWSLRHYLMGASKRWHAYDWQADKDLIASRKRNEKHRETLAKTTRAFRQSIGRSAFRKAERDLGVSIAAALCPDAKIEMTYGDGCNAIANALREFESQSLRPDCFPVRFGPLLYDKFPARLPGREIAIALVLADFATGFRKDKHRAGGIHFPRAPVLSSKLPWKAIAEFATASSDDPEAAITPENVATGVRNLCGKVARILRYP
ncbi:hypothetical protein [Novosphingobium sp. EMRT-2]|uniref:hypothetical protein n=1 Tax=Novosphingobium sp. EMRT-2 TaxID=2571749 RepID=UPI0010BE13B6|nr:hypothetical protein [Novosphingobium sp. EMRT-2]QCI93900.1 hypothetical protein FA702_10290 [Novosphingobium sp. EMRT-2]